MWDILLPGYADAYIPVHLVDGVVPAESKPAKKNRRVQSKRRSRSTTKLEKHDLLVVVDVSISVLIASRGPLIPLRKHRSGQRTGGQDKVGPGM